MKNKIKKSIVTLLMVTFVFSVGVNFTQAKELTNSETILIIELFEGLGLITSEQAQLIITILNSNEDDDTHLPNTNEIDPDNHIKKIDVKLNTDVNYSNNGSEGFATISLEGDKDNLEVNNWKVNLDCKGDLLVQNKDGSNLCDKDYVFYKNQYYDVTDDLVWFTLPIRNDDDLTSYLTVEAVAYDNWNNRIGSDKVKIKFYSAYHNDNENYENQNITFSDVKIQYPDGMEFGGKSGLTQEMKITAVLKNNEYAPVSLSGEKAEYDIYLFNLEDSREAISKVASGEVSIPYRNGYSEFSAYIEAGEPFDGENFEKTYQALIKLDMPDSFEEAEDDDNEIWTDSWVITYWKG